MALRFVPWLKNSRSTGLFYSFILPAAFLLFLALLVATIFIGKDQTEKSLKRGIEAIRGSRYPKAMFENLQPALSPRPSLQPSPQSQPAPQMQHQPFPHPSPQHQLEPDPQAQPQPSLQMQMQPQPSPRHQLEPQPSPQLEQQMSPHHSSPRHQLEPQPSPQLEQQMQQESPPPLLQLHPEDQSQCRPPGSESLPKGLVSDTADLQMQPLWGRRKKINSTTSLFTAAVGIKQKETVDKMVRKFLSCNFNVMLFHYDGIVDAWKDLDWASNVVHVSAANQTKWWFAKRFLHPDIVAEYSHIFLWDEDLGVDNFDPDRYLSIVKEEGLEISQPALDVEKSEVHHAITARWSNATVHRRAKPGSNSKGCNSESEYPPCTGWVELMVPVFSRAAWRCIWYMIQKDLNHAWGLDILFGYCAQGDRTKNVGVVDAEYVVHYAFPTFGENTGNQDPSEPNPRTELGSVGGVRRRMYAALSSTEGYNGCLRESLGLWNIVSEKVRRHSFREYKIFRKRWQIAAKEDESWVDPYPGSLNISMI